MTREVPKEELGFVDEECVLFELQVRRGGVGTGGGGGVGGSGTGTSERSSKKKRKLGK